MKTKEFIQKYELDTKFLSKEKSNQLVADLAAEFTAVCESMKIKDDIKKFDAAIKQFRTKWDAISLKSKKGLSDGLWRFFYASIICPKRDELCPSFAKRKAEKDRKRKEWEAKQEAKRRSEYDPE